MPKIVLAGGGTGGHITPILNCAQALNKLDKNLQIHVFSKEGEISGELLAGTPWQLHYVQAGKFRRYRSRGFLKGLLDFKTWGQNLADLIRLKIGILQSLAQLYKLKPAVVFVKGGYVGLPVGIAAWVLGIPLVIHESDARAGLTNRILAHLARTIATGWPLEYYPKWQHKHLVFTGNIVPVDLSSMPKPPEARSLFKLPPLDLPVLLVMGGSGGSRALNDAILGHLAEITAKYQVIHITGRADYDRVAGRADTIRPAADHYRSYGFLGADLKLAYQLADVILTRAGANSLAEIMAVGKPAIVVPYPYSTSGHQAANAAILDDFEAAVVIREEDLNKKLMHTLEDIQNNAPKTKAMIKHLRSLHVEGSAEKLAKEIMAYI